MATAFVTYDKIKGAKYHQQDRPVVEINSMGQATQGQLPDHDDLMPLLETIFNSAGNGKKMHVFVPQDAVYSARSQAR